MPQQRSAKLTVCTLALALLAADAGAQQTRDVGGRAVAPPASTRSGTSVLTGTVVTDDGRPARRATVRLSGLDTAGPRIAVTDEAGRFVFTRLPAGSFTLSAVKPGYVTSYYGSKRPGRGPAVPVALAEGQRLTVSLAMLRGAAIAGTLTDAFGRPAPQVMMRAKLAAERSTAPPPGDASWMGTTDDRGMFRLYGLAPGDYVLFALPRASSTGEALVTTDEEVRWALQPLAPATTGGSAPSSTPVLPPPGRAMTYSPVYSPGTTEPDAATKITLGPGEERDGLAFSLRFTPTAKIEGTLVVPGGQPALVLLQLLPSGIGSAPAFETMFDAGLGGIPRVPVSPDGTFSIAGVTAGKYFLRARTGLDASGRGAGPGATTAWGEAEVHVDGRDLSGVVVALQPGQKVNGRVVFDRTATAVPSDLSSVRVAMTPARFGANTMFGTPLVTVSPAGALHVPSAPPGPYTIQVTPPPVAAGATRWALQSVMVGGRDVTDGPLDLRPGEDLDGLVVTFTDRQTEVSGTLLDAAGRPTQEFSIVVFTTNRAFWSAGSRRVQSARPATNGSFRIMALPAGEYAIAAVTDLEPDMLSDPGYLEQLRAAAFAFKLAEGEKRQQDFRIK